jgi:hypothetical protein
VRRKQYRLCLGLGRRESCEPGLGLGILDPASASSMVSHCWLFGSPGDPWVFDTERERERERERLVKQESSCNLRIDHKFCNSEKQLQFCN